MKDVKPKKTASTTSVLKKLSPFIGRHWIGLVASIVLAGAMVVLQLYVPILFGDAIDLMVGEGRVSFEGIASYTGRIIMLVCISAICTWFMSLINNRIAFGIVREIRSTAIVPLSYLDSHSTGDIVSRITTDTDILSDGLLLGFTQLFSGVITVFVTLFFMFSKNVTVSVLVVVLTPLSFVVARFISRRSFNLFKKQSEVRGRQTGFIEEIVGNQKVVKAFGYEDRSSSRFRKINDELVDCSQQAVFYSSLTNPSTRFVNSLVYACVALVGILLVSGGSLTVGGLSVLLAYANQYMKPFNDISSVVTEMQNALACASRLFSFLEEKEETPEASLELGAVGGSVDIKDVSFRYEKDHPLIEDLNVHAEPGMKIAIVGPTGCGKTTIINLLMRFYDVDSGTISIDGTPIKDITRHSLRRNYGMVLQDTWLKGDTVRENIRFGKPDASDEEIIEAAKASHCWEFIQRLPNSLDTILSDDGISQGQKQLLCIARVMLCHPPMLILDEATSSIDTRTEILIQQAFDTLMKGRTSFVVAHRLSTIRNASLILVMKDGHIMEQGTHDELLSRGGFYEKLYNSQFQQV